MDKDTLPPQKCAMDAATDEAVITPETVSAQRRKLLRASAAAVPAIMTLRSGAAAAAARTSMDCRHKDEQKAEEFPPDNVLGDQAGEPDHDQWLRVFAQLGKMVNAKVKGVDGVYLIAEPESSLEPLQYFDSTGKRITDNGSITQIDNGAAVPCYFVDNGNWEAIPDVTGGCNAAYCKITLLPGSEITSYEALAADPPVYKQVQLLVSVVWSMGGTTAELTYYPQTTDFMGSPITESCWCSVDPNASPLG